MEKQRRIPSERDFPVEVEGVGKFIFARRSMRDEIKINVEQAKLLEGGEPTAWLGLLTLWICTIAVLVVQMPDNVCIDLDDLDPHDEATYARLRRIHEALVAKELSFRRTVGANSEAGGAESNRDGGVSLAP